MEQASMKNLFRSLIVAQVLVWVAIVYAAPRSWIHLQRMFYIPDSYFHTSLVLGRMMEFVFYAEVIACLSMLGFWNFTRHIFTGVAIAYMLLVCFDPVVVRDGIRDSLNVADGLLTGLILAMAYFSPLRDAFAKSQTPMEFAAVAGPPPFPPPPAPAPESRVCAACGAGEQEGRFCTQCGGVVR